MKSLYKIILLLTFILIYSYRVFGQEKVNLYGGLGIPEQFVLGIRFQFNQVQLGVGIGGGDKYTTTLSSDVSYHFGGSSQKSDRRPWYIKGGLSKWIDSSKDPDRFNYPLGIYFRIGRDINFCNKVGLNIESGMIIGKLANELQIYGHAKTFPSLGIFLFYRI